MGLKMKLKVGDRVKYTEETLNLGQGIFITNGDIFKVIGEYSGPSYIRNKVKVSKSEVTYWLSVNSIELVPPVKDEEGDVQEEKDGLLFSCGCEINKVENKTIENKCPEHSEAEDKQEFDALPCNCYFHGDKPYTCVKHRAKKQFEESIKSAAKSLHIGTPRIKQCGCAYYSECDIFYKCSECEGKTLKPEDLKVEMMFSYKTNFYKIMKISQDTVFFFYVYKDELDCSSYRIEFIIQWFKEDKIKLIDKVPPKIVEVEEEIEVFCHVDDLSHYSLKPYIQAFKRTVNGIPADKEKEFEFCKIKRTVKKELNWDWNEGIWV